MTSYSRNRISLFPFMQVPSTLDACRRCVPGRRLLVGMDYQLGRDPASGIVLDDARVSWRHAVFRHEQGTWILGDAGSTNGAFVGTDRVYRITISVDS